jgi:hypothetical protein
MITGGAVPVQSAAVVSAPGAERLIHTSSSCGTGQRVEPKRCAQRCSTIASLYYAGALDLLNRLLKYLKSLYLTTCLTKEPLWIGPFKRWLMGPDAQFWRSFLSDRHR